MEESQTFPCRAILASVIQWVVMLLNIQLISNTFIIQQLLWSQWILLWRDSMNCTYDSFVVI